MKNKDDQLTFHINYVNRVYPIIIMVLCLMIIGGLYVVNSEVLEGLYIVNSEVLEANSLISEFQRTDTGKGQWSDIPGGGATCTLDGKRCKAEITGDDGYDPNVCDHIQTHCEDHTCTEDCMMEVP